MNDRLPLVCLGTILLVLLWSGIGPHDYPTWALEVAPVIIALPVLLATYRKFRLTDLAYILITIHAIILMVGGHYTYALVPLFDWLRDITDGTRNNYDSLGHLAQGFIPAIVARELLIRTSDLKPGKWMFTLIVFACFGIAAVYEIIEWLSAVILGQGAEQFLGTQGYIWDTQKDMLLAGIGAALSQLLLSRLHDRQLAKI
jgi:putative membrane protein